MRPRLTVLAPAALPLVACQDLTGPADVEPTTPPPAREVLSIVAMAGQQDPRVQMIPGRYIVRLSGRIQNVDAFEG